MRKNDIEKSLKRFLKRKISYSLSLLIAFMITGGISFGAGITTEEIQETKNDILTRIETEREEIKRKIAENERLIKEYNSDFVELVRKGDFYSKPLIPSTQVFFSYQYLDNGKTKDRTAKEFKETIDAVNKHYGTTSGESLLKSTGNIGKDKVLSGNGVVVDNEVFRETIEVGANIKPVEPVLPTISPNVSVNVSAPVVNLGTLPGTVNPIMPSVPSVIAPTITAPSTPGGINVNVSTPAAVAKITVTAPTAKTPAIPAEKNITVSTPTAPEGYEPTMIVSPSEPVISLPNIIIPSLITYPGFGSSISDQYDYWGGGNSSTMIDQITITAGKFKATSGSGAYILGYQGTGGIKATSSVIERGSPTGTIPADGNNSLSRNFFFGIRNSAFIEWAPEVEISWFTGSGNQQLIYMETSTTSHQTLDSLKAGGVLEPQLYNEINGYKNQTNLHDNSGGATGINLHNNKGTIYLGDSDTRYQATTTISGTRLSVFNNEGIITGLNMHNLNSGINGSSKQVVYFNTPDTSSYQKWIYGNGSSGKINLYGSESIAMYYTSSSGSQQQYVETGFVNNGEINLYGINSSGIMVRSSENLKAQSGFYLNTPINIYSDGSRGVYIAGNISNFSSSSQAIVRVNIGENKNDTDGINWKDIETGNNILVNSNGNISGNSTDTVDNAVGVMYTSSSTGAKIQTPNITLEKFSKNSIGIYVAAGKLTVDNGNIYIKGGEKNIAILSKADTSNGLSGGDINYTGNINISSSTLSTTGGLTEATSAIAAYIEGKEFNMTGNIDVNSKDSVTLYAKDGSINVNGNISINSYGKDVIALYANNATISANKTSLSGNEDIFITGDNTSGVGLYATNNGKINVKNTYVKVKNGSVGIASVGSGSKIDIRNGIVDYEGNGYAVYSDGVGTIDLTDGEIILRGKATALELDLSNPSSNPITLSGTKIVVMSNDAVGVNLKNIGVLNIGSLKTDIENKLGGVNIVAGTDGSQVFDKYKIAAVDGGTLNLNANMDKSDTDTNSTGFFYYRRFLGQRLKLNVSTGIEVKSEINSSDATAYFKGQVVGLEMNSSKSATSATDAQINLEMGSKVISDRIDSGAGAIGLYMNFGAINLAAGSKIEVEKVTSGGNVVNDKAVGIYAVNGSTVSNAGDIEVGGNKSIGILGMAYREDSSNNAIADEFGTTGIFTAQGKIDITNNGNITLDGAGTIGIYADNNNTSGTKNGVVVTNTNNGVIKVGASDGSNAAIGIYGKKATISNLGKISVGDGGVAIYATEESEITNLGILDLGADGVGVMVDGTSDISATSVTLTSNNTGTLGKTGVFYKGSASGIDNKSIGLNINAENLDKGTAIYVENMNVTSSGTLNVGKEGIGIFVKGNSTQTGTNTGTIDLTAGKNDAVGMYTTTANLLNNTGGSINVNDTSQIGMYAEEANHKATNKGTINLNADSSTGIYVKLGAVAELDTGNSIAFNKKFSVGVFAENATVNFKDDLTFANNNENKNIYVYGKGATVGIDPGKIVTVDGMGTPATAGNKTVGIYLENAGTGSTFTSNTTGQLVVQREAVGIYSKGNNTLNVNVTATGEKTTGVFIDGGSTITGTVTARGASGVGAVGVYGSGGAVTIGAGGLTLNTDTDKGTGMYLADGAYASGGKITVNNTATVDNIGVYYSKGTASGTVTNGAEVELTGNKSIGIYAADGINLVNTKNITSTGGSNNIASYVGGNSTLTSTGNITMTGTGGNIGIYTGKGSGINNGAIDLTGSTGTSSAGMVAKTDTSSDTASVENKNTITVGSNLGMYVAGNGTSSGKNTGTITATTGTGVYVDGAAHSFNGTGGTIASNAVGIYLKDTGANKITAGTLNIGSGGVGVFGENAKIDFAVNVTGTGAVGVAAKSGTVISGNITTGQGSVGAYLLDGTVTFNGANITTGANSSSGTSVGVLFDNTIAGPYTMNNVSVNAKNGVGIYLGGAGMTLNHNGTVTTEGGIGIYVKNGTTLTTGESTLNISNGGTGVYIDGGIANLGTSGNLKFNFGTGGGIGVFNNGGTLNLGNNITAIGSGSLAATSNGSLISSGNLNIGEGGTGLLGTYDNGTTTLKNITNNGGTITAHTGGIGLAAIKGTSTPTAKVTINNSGIINANGISNGVNPSPSIGIFTDVADVINTGTINVGSNGIGIYSNHNGVLTSVKNDNMKMTGTDGIGVYLKGTTAGLTSNNINSTGSRNTGVVLEGVTSAIDAGTITLGNESIGVLATNGTNSLIDGTISVGASSGTKSAIGIVANGGSNVTVAGTSTITAGNGGIGVYAEGAGTIVTVADTGNITVGTDGIYMYSKGAALTFTGNITADNQIGIVADGGSVTSSGSSSITAKNGGIGAYVKNAAPAFGTTAITVQSGVAETTSAPAKYSVGIYYDSVASAGIIPTVTQTGNYTIGRVLNKSTGTVSGGISIGSSGNNQVGVMAKENSNLTVTGGISVIGGNSNIGVYGKSSAIAVNGNISVASAASLTNSSIGVFIDKGTYNGTTGDISVGNNSIGIYGKDLNGGSISQTGTVMTVSNSGVGIYGTGTGNGTENINLTMTTGITLGNNNSIGVYAKNINTSVTGDIHVGTNTSIGIVSEGNGNVTYSGDLTIEDKGTVEGSTGSVGIYKLDGTGIVNVLAGSWNVGNNGYGIFLKQAAGDSATINNDADMILETSAVGIFSSGKNTVNNIGDITVGKTDVNGDHDKTDKHLNSIGMYLTGGTVATSSGTITVNHDHSVGVYGEGEGTRFTNTGTINVDNGGVGILVRNGAVAVNAVGGDINLGGTLASCGAVTIGMASYGVGATIINNGTITVNQGAGMLVGTGTIFENNGTIVVNNGVGIEGIGSTINAGHIVVNGGSAIGNGGLATAEIGSVTITPDGTIKINGNYTSIGGTLSTAGNIIVDGAYVDVTTGTPLFNANSVSGEVKLLPNFAATGNGISYEIDGFVNTAMGAITGTKLTPVTSPLFIAKVTDKGSLVIAKRPYADLVIGEQFDALHKGLDNILKNSGGSGRDADILKGLNEYLEGLPADQFERETSLKLAETRGDIYATIQGRMQDINRAFDNSFYELESSYNMTKDSSKYSVIYTDGNYKDSTLGIDDYDYKVMGLLYMKEKEGTEYGSKYGYTIGFAGSKFDFDDGGSKEDVYSLRVGAHRVKNLSEEHKVSWLSRIELGYNRHIAKRKLNLQETFENKGEYNTYSVALDNRLTKVIYTDLSRQLDVYADLDLEYGKVDDFKESAGSKGGLEVQIKDNDYLSAQAGAGVKASQRIYAGNDVSVKVTADVKYAYELGDNYDGNKARLKNGGEGYYSLITPEESEGKLTGKIGLTIEKANYMGVTFEVEAADEGNRKDSSIKYGMRFNYKF